MTKQQAEEMCQAIANAQQQYPPQGRVCNYQYPCHCDNTLGQIFRVNQMGTCDCGGVRYADN